MQTNPSVLGRGHEGTDLCRQGATKVLAHAATVEAWRALTHHFTVDGEPLIIVKYLGQFMSMDNFDR